MALNLGLVRSFWHIASAGSVSEAARRHFVSQPALSKAVRELETQLGLVLFERGARGVKLTVAGELLFERASVIFALEREAEDALRALKTSEAAPLRIGASTTISTYFLPALLAQFRERVPGVRPSLIRDNTHGIEERLVNFELDVALVEGPPHHPKIENRFWRDDELILVCAPNHPLAARKSVNPEELHEFAWLRREKESGTREVVEEALRKWNLPPADCLEIGSAEALKQGVAADLGIAFVSRTSAAEGLALGTLHSVKVRGVELRRPFYLLHLIGRPLSPAARAFEEFLGVTG